MDRRTFIVAGASLLGACQKPWFLAPSPPDIVRPGMEAGHMLRDARGFPAPTEEVQAEVAILGSGIAGLSCAWKLAREGMAGVLLVNGPEVNGNASAARFDVTDAPRGAHYLPLPSLESVHVREMLFDFGIIEADPYGTHPTYDETALVHAPVERLLVNGKWQEALLPSEADEALRAQQTRFLALLETWRNARGKDGRRAFVVPRVLSSRDPAFTRLDGISMKQWLLSQGFDAPSIHWYCDYACRDDYGVGYERTSAWAGLHYFVARNGLAANAEPGAVLTWPSGLARLADKLRTAPRKHPWQVMDGFAVKVTHTDRGTESWVMEGGRCVRVKAKHVVLAMPLMVAARVLEGAHEFGLEPHTPPAYASWLVGNVGLANFPRELPGAPLAWDNVIHGSRGLGYVVATHQRLHLAGAPGTVFTTYQALSDLPHHEARRWLHEASPDELVERALMDLHTAYPRGLMRHIQRIELTLRAHAMCSPEPGFLQDGRLETLRQGGKRLHFAHADLSGISVFEEAAWWGVAVARRILGEAGGHG